ncbi:hypothetical protein [Microcoleus sp. FACHB-SPT15]|uniref:hypothetical protein n=1 Tax=Microcoleus sp. FACHB-SPT15 TaxID=2692830 RepID=UPI0037CAD231
MAYNQPFFDPLCGSGTLPLEASLKLMFDNNSFQILSTQHSNFMQRYSANAWVICISR